MLTCLCLQIVISSLRFYMNIHSASSPLLFKATSVRVVVLTGVFYHILFVVVQMMRHFGVLNVFS